MRTDGGRGSFLNLPSKNNMDSIVDEIDFLSGGFSPIQMNGQEVYKFAVKEVPLILQKLLKKMKYNSCLLYTSPSPRDQRGSRMPSSA